jgi:uncharacterized protein
MSKGFGSLSPELRRAISSKGGKSAHAQGLAHEYTSEEARLAGSKGGVKTKERLGPEGMKALGRLGGQAKAAKRRSPSST